MEEKVLNILREVLNEQNVDETSSNLICENWDSIRHLMIMSELEESFGIELEPEEMASMTNVKEIITVLKTKL